MINKYKNIKAELKRFSLAVHKPDFTFSQYSQRTVSNLAFQLGDGAWAKECLGRGALHGPLSRSPGSDLPHFTQSNQMEDLKLNEGNVGGTLSYTLKNKDSKKQWVFSAAPTSIQI